jgi:hypothetical protein
MGEGVVLRKDMKADVDGCDIALARSPDITSVGIA